MYTSPNPVDQASNRGPASVPATHYVDVAIVGTGFGGLCMAIQLRRAGIDNFVILEKAQGVGGTWRENSYPGAACDVQSHMYSFSFAPKHDWSQRFAPQAEIHAYIEKTTDEYGLRPFIRYGQQVVRANFDEHTGRWTIHTAAGQVFVARHWVLASGPLHVPAFPAIKGLENFKGKVMHSAQWDHDYDLAGKNVVSIGTGASAIQYVPEIAPKVKQLHVFQRSAAWVMPRDERKYSALGKAIFKAFPAVQKLHRWQLYWTNEARMLPMLNPWMARAGELIVKSIIRRKVKDPVIRRKLTPDYALGCKRVLISNKWFPTFNRPNVELVTEGIREIREHSIVSADGKERQADCIVLGTGFIVDPRIYMKDFEITGRDGHVLSRDWAKVPTAYLGINITGFPNMHQLVGPHTGLGHNSIIFMIEAQVHYVIQCIKEQRARGADYVDVKPQAQQAFVAEVMKNLEGTVWTSGCKSWYQTAEGINFALWPKSTWAYWMQCRNVVSGDYQWVTCGQVPASRPVETKLAA
ncbi:MAG: NAD(P)/FAD-dependent oxidoreductase [Aquabacterium sp.]|jgi:cation diffusion facilitator CzcD-associated flavoprotein CzcO|nr:MAG: NAD(P)/FAD-dependent oxidoreductase [Aquabacterium sp.]